VNRAPDCAGGKGGRAPQDQVVWEAAVYGGPEPHRLGRGVQAGRWVHKKWLKPIGQEEFDICSSLNCTSWLAIKWKLIDIIRYFLPQIWNVHAKQPHVPHFKKVNSVTHGQKWMAKWSVFSTTYLGHLLSPAFPAGNSSFGVNTPSSAL
jgi:hypothetical protein